MIGPAIAAFLISGMLGALLGLLIVMVFDLDEIIMPVVLIVGFIPALIVSIMVYNAPPTKKKTVVETPPTTSEINAEVAPEEILYSRSSILDKPKIIKYDPNLFRVEFKNGDICYAFKGYGMSCKYEE